MGLEAAGRELVLNGLKNQAAQVRIKYEEYVGATLDGTQTSSPINITWGTPYSPSGVDFWRLDATNTSSMFWTINVNDPFTNIKVTSVQIIDSSGNLVADKQVVDDPFDESERVDFPRTGEFIIEQLTIAVL